jgi:mRNA interferase MazF
MTPARGEVWLFDVGLVAKVCPAQVLSLAYGDTDRALLTILRYTTSLRGSQFEVADVPFLKQGAFMVQNVFVSEREGHPETRCAQERPVRRCVLGSASMAWAYARQSVVARQNSLPLYMPATHFS